MSRGRTPGVRLNNEDGRHSCSICGCRGVNNRTCPGDLLGHEQLVREKELKRLAATRDPHQMGVLDVGIPMPTVVIDAPIDVDLIDRDVLGCVSDALRAIADALDAVQGV